MDESIPRWAADLRVDVARIQGATSRIEGLQATIEAIKANQVPLSEHLAMKTQVEQLWSEREQGLGRKATFQTTRRVIVLAVSVVASVVGTLVALRTLGFRINLG